MNARPRAVRAPRNSKEPSARAAAAADKRERILRAAVKVFARKGFYASRVSEIASAAGVADGTIYLYFKNKDDVLTSLFEDRISRLLSVLERELATQPTARAKVRRLIELQLGLLEGQRELAEVVTVNLRQSNKLLKQYGAQRFGEYLELMARVVAEGQRAGELRPELSPRVVARALFGALDGLALTWALGPQKAPGSLQKSAGQLAELMLGGLSVPGTEEPRRESPAAE